MFLFYHPGTRAASITRNLIRKERIHKVIWLQCPMLDAVYCYYVHYSHPGNSLLLHLPLPSYCCSYIWIVTRRNKETGKNTSILMPWLSKISVGCNFWIELCVCVPLVWIRIVLKHWFKMDGRKLKRLDLKEEKRSVMDGQKWEKMERRDERKEEEKKSLWLLHG